MFSCRKRKYSGPPDPPGYFDQIVWPSYEQLRNSCRVQNTGIALWYILMCMDCGIVHCSCCRWLSESSRTASANIKARAHCFMW